MNRWILGLWALGLLTIGTLVGCGGEGAESPSTDEEQASDDAAKARSETTLGPVTFTLEVEPSQPRLSDEPVLTITIDAEEGVKVHKPPFGESLSGFLIRDYREPLPEVVDGRQILRQIYTLEATRTGEHVIAPLPLEFEDLRPNGDGQSHKMESEAVVVDVISMLEGDVPSLSDLEGPQGPMELPAEKPPWAMILTIGIFSTLLSIGAVVWWVRRSGKKVSVEKKLSPKELAYLELQELIERDWIAQGELQTFYVELTGVVRRYIERTTGLRAPEQTTEEFLREMQGSDAIESERKQALRAFLESADLVKFAAFEPDATEIEKSFTRAKEFVGLQAGETAKVGGAS